MTRAPYLIVDEHSSRDGWRLSWYIPEDEDIGGSIGETEYHESHLRHCDPDDRESVVAYLAAVKTDGARRDGSRGLVWESKSAATAALRVVKAALKADADGRPLPDWAKQALAAGWKAPKGWKP